MATFNSNEMALGASEPRGIGRPSDGPIGGRVRVEYFSFTTPTGTLQNDVVRLCRLPANSKVLGGHIAHEGMASSSTMSIGVSGSTSKYASGVSVATSPGSFSYANTLALNYQAIEAASVVLIATLGGAAWGDAKSFKGHILYEAGD